MSEAARLPPAAALWLLACVTVTLAPHALRLPGWLGALCALLLAWRAWLLWQAGAPPHRLVIVLVALAAGVDVNYHFDHFFGKDPGVALLAVLLCLKLLEVRRARDIRAAVLLGLFLQLGVFFDDQSLPVAAAALTGTLLAVVTLLALEDSRSAARAQLRLGTLLLAQGLPFMLALFVLFPRVQGPLWGLPADAWSALTGLSDSMAPGSISQLSLSEAIAFRARFDGPPPAPAQRYWRGPVLTDFDGSTWRARPAPLTAEPAYVPRGPRYDYQLTLEAHDRNWLLALDFPAGAPPGARYASDFRLLSEHPLRARSRFELRAYPQTPVGIDEHPDVVAAARRLPPRSNPRTQALGRRLAAGGPSAETVLARALEHLRALTLTYTLRPPPLGTHSVDEFLFDTGRGFCEHFSSAFVFLMRAAGVPARVVTGYQGGEINPVDTSLVVRQSDAHAWAEVWIAGRGWVRVDPTALAAPQRIEGGLAAALPQGEPLPFMLRPALAWLRDLRHQWEAATNVWNQRVLGYNPERQRELLARLGMPPPEWKSLGLVLGGTLGALMLALLGWAVRQRRRVDPLDRAWDAFCHKLARRGSARAPWEGPADYAQRLAAAHPRHAAELRDISLTYARLRYGPPETRAAIDALAHRIRRLKLE
jgi:transglutaminase-like putative cysteine protease